MLRGTPRSDQREVTTSDGIRLRVGYAENIDKIFHGRSDEPITLCDVSYITDSRSIFFIPQGTANACNILDAIGAHIVGEKLTFSCEKNGSYLQTSRLAHGTVGAKHERLEH